MLGLINCHGLNVEIFVDVKNYVTFGTDMAKKPVVFPKLTVQELDWLGKYVSDFGWLSMYKNARGLWNWKIAIRGSEGDKEDLQMIRSKVGGYWGEQKKEGETYYWLNIQSWRCIRVLGLLKDRMGARQREAELILETYQMIFGRRRKNKAAWEEKAKPLVDEFKQLEYAWRDEQGR